MGKVFLFDFDLSVRCIHLEKDFLFLKFGNLAHYLETTRIECGESD
jgi:hypothetical protein